MSNRPFTDIPGFGWTRRIDHRLADKTVGDLAKAFERRAVNAFDPRIRRLRNEVRHEGPALAKIAEEIGKRAASVELFVQIGAHDGSFDDPFAAYIRDHDWRALLVEPQAAQHARLAERYAGNDRVMTQQVAVGAYAGSLTLYSAVLPELDAFGTAIAASNPMQVRREVKRCVGIRAARSLHVREETVEMVTVPELFERSGIDAAEISMFASDTEGNDIAIIDGLLGETDARPEIIQYEHLHTDPSAAGRVNARLRKLGYELVKTHKDTLAYK